MQTGQRGLSAIDLDACSLQRDCAPPVTVLKALLVSLGGPVQKRKLGSHWSRTTSYRERAYVTKTGIQHSRCTTTVPYQIGHDTTGETNMPWVLEINDLLEVSISRSYIRVSVDQLNFQDQIAHPRR
jgi:hypothetical protein